jgi:release factor glutamine methyltransferase
MTEFRLPDGTDFTLDGGTTRLAALKNVGEVFRAAGIETAQRDARLLLLDAAKLQHADLIRAPRETLGDETAGKLAGTVARRLNREPVARILGEWEFWSLPFTLTPAALVPRPDSETVVSAALLALGARRHASEGLRILDLGVGSGALLVALLTELKGAVGVGLDLSVEAVDTARFNATRNGVGERARFIVSDWSKALDAGVDGPFDLVISNPPYIADAVLEGLEPEVRLHDPRLALSGGADGLDAYRAIAAELPGLLSEDGVAALEIGSDQVGDVTALFGAAGFTVEGPYADFGARPRALVLRRG